MIAVGQTVGNYKITAKLGEGGMGVVYLAEHPVIGRKVAMKAIHPELSRNPEVISRFVTEAKSVNQIGNEHIVDINDFGNTADGEFYFVMEFLQGESLADRLKRERGLPAPRALKIAAQVADALAASHEHGIVHRDLKPENIYLITRGTNTDFVKVLDFGLAKLTQGEEKVTHKTRTGSVMGTPYYMSPEQCEGKPNVDHRADIYSLGVILFEMLTGKVPFGGEGYGEIIVKHITQPPPSVKAINPLLTDSHESLVLRSLAKNRDERFQTMGDFRTAILDPEGFHATQPARPGGGRVTNLPGASVPSHAPDDHPSAGTGQIVFGEGADLGARPAPMPTTFRTNAGELIDDGVAVKSRKGLVLGVVGAAAVAGLAAFFMMRGRAEPPPPVSAAAVAPEPMPSAKPELPEKVKLVFHSEPKGASVIRLDTKETLGTTPLDIELPYGKQPIDFRFQKAGYEEKQRTVVPQAFTQVDVELDEVEKPALPDEGKKPSGSSAASKRPRPTSGSSGGGRKSGGGKGPVDEDAVLAPSF